MDSSELPYWRALEGISPYLRRADYHAALISSTIATVMHAVVGGKGQPPKLEDYLLKFEEAVVEQLDAQTIEQRLLSWARTHNASLEQKSGSE